MLQVYDAHCHLRAVRDSLPPPPGSGSVKALWDLIFDDEKPQESVTTLGSPERLPTKVQRGLFQGTGAVLERTHDE